VQLELRQQLALQLLAPQQLALQVGELQLGPQQPV
jgi:hypothetical protein